MKETRRVARRKMNSIAQIARRALKLPAHSNGAAIVNLRCYCSPLSSSSSPAPNSKLFVAGLSWSVDEKSLKDAFSTFGEVTEEYQETIPLFCGGIIGFNQLTMKEGNVKIIYDKDSGRSRGFGFVHFSKEDDAESAKDAMDGKALLGRPLRINFALERVRGQPVVVPRITNNGDFSSRNT